MRADGLSRPRFYNLHCGRAAQVFENTGFSDHQITTWYQPFGTEWPDATLRSGAWGILFQSIEGAELPFLCYSITSGVDYSWTSLRDGVEISYFWLYISSCPPIHKLVDSDKICVNQIEYSKLHSPMITKDFRIILLDIDLSFLKLLFLSTSISAGLSALPLKPWLKTFYYPVAETATAAHRCATVVKSEVRDVDSADNMGFLDIVRNILSPQSMISIFWGTMIHAIQDVVIQHAAAKVYCCCCLIILYSL